MVKRACVLNPNMAQVWCHVGYILVHMGEYDDGIASIERAIRLSPLDSNLHNFLRGIARAHLLAGRYHQAIDRGERSLGELAKSAHALRTLTAAYALSGNLVDAHRILAMLREVQPSLRLSTASETIAAYHDPSDMRRFLDGLRLRVA